MRRELHIIVALASFMLVACAALMPREAYFSRPKIQTASNAAFDVQLAPEKQGHPYYVSFQLTLENKSDQPLVIDWERTRYLNQGRDLGVFVFDKTTSARSKLGLPEETVPPGATLSKRISPARTLVYRPRQEGTQPGQGGFFPGILPAGVNTVLLVVEQDGRLWRQHLTMTISAGGTR